MVSELHGSAGSGPRAAARADIVVVNAMPKARLNTSDLYPAIFGESRLDSRQAAASYRIIGGESR